MNKGINHPLNRHDFLISGFSTIGMALCYISLFILFGAIITFPAGEQIIAKIEYMQQELLLLSVAYGVGYLLFGCLLAFSVHVLDRHFSQHNYTWAKYGSLFGYVWVVLMMCAGMTSLLGMNMTVNLLATKPDTAVALFYAQNMVVNGLGGGIELVSGVWVLVISILGLKHKQFYTGLHVLGVVVGLVGIMTIWHTVGVLKDMFGLSQIVWFIWLGIALLKQRRILENE
ncbi:MAG: hypothetical protein GJ680_13355 [Alteromonadaceae bacterium]|nr:hypothetical protein [Alteromonadaceae bacterium]